MKFKTYLSKQKIRHFFNILVVTMSFIASVIIDWIAAKLDRTYRI